MSVEDGRISNRFDIVMSPNGTGDLQVVFNRPDIKLLRWFFEDAPINTWSKFKPFRASPHYNDHYDSAASARMAALKASNFGLSIISCFRSEFASKYAQNWAYNRPNANNYLDRVWDFEQYQNDATFWQANTGDARYIRTIFNGMLTIPSSSVSDLDTISFTMQCRENDDIDPYLGLLYPYDFQGAAKDFSAYYIGIAILDSSNNVWVISDKRISDYYSGTQLYSGISVQISSSMANGALIIAPVLTDSRVASWSNSFGGDMVLLNGAYLSAMKTAQADSLRTNVAISVGASSVTLTFEVRNQTGNAVTIGNMYAYLLSDAAYINEHDSGYTGPDYVGEGAVAYINRTWPTNYKQGDIYSHDWQGGSTNPDELAARAYNAYTDFYAANGNSNIIGNNITRTWSKTINYTDDDFGAYANGAWLMLCLSAGGSSFVRDYKSF